MRAWVISHAVYARPLTIFEMVKLHVMTDVFHVLQHAATRRSAAN